MSDLFSQDTLAKAVHDSLDAAYAAIPADKRHAVIFDGTAAQGSSGVRAMYVQRIDGGWNVVLEGDVDTAHGAAGHVVIAKSW